MLAARVSVVGDRNHGRLEDVRTERLQKARKVGGMFVDVRCIRGMKRMR